MPAKRSQRLTIATRNNVGRPTKYEPETVDRLLSALTDGLTQKQACIASGICENTLAVWREKYPELEPRLQQAREQARQKADAHRDDGRRFIVRADELLTAFLELERAVCIHLLSEQC